MKKERRSKTALLVWTIIFAVILLVAFVATMIATQNAFIRNTINSVLGGSERYLKSGDPSVYQYYEADYESKADALRAANALNERIVEEGIILLENDGTLPLAKSSRITVLGKNSADLVLGGSGSNAGSSSTAEADVVGSLETAGFVCNPVTEAFYADDARSGGGRPEEPAMGDVITGFPTGETSSGAYDKSVTDSFDEYNDAAVVIISRIGGEGFDLPRTMFWDGADYLNWDASTVVPGAASADSHYLELDLNEQALLTMACDRFENVVVVFNSASPIETGFLTSGQYPQIKAALWMGAPGVSGISSLVIVLSGDVVPSGHTVDTFAADFTADPTWQNFGNNRVKNGNTYKLNGKAVGAYYVEYREGIYNGYRWYETKGKEAGGTWYDDNVVYPFGYGKSYTDFGYSVTPSVADGAALAADGTLSFEVNVTNLGEEYAGKDVVQLYYSAPYTEGGIEKAHVVLGDFAKTKEIAAGGSDTVTLSIDVRDMASYDYDDANGDGYKGWQLDGGTYTLYVTEDAHGWADESAIKFTYTVPDGGYRFEKDDKTQTEITNLFDDVSSGIDRDDYLSRAGGFANFGRLSGGFSEENRAADQAFIDSLTYKLADKSTDPWYTDTAPEQSGKVLSRSETTVKLYDLIGKKYDDPLWKTLLDQLTVNQLVELMAQGNFQTIAIENIDKPLTTDADGPMGFALFMGSNSVYDTCYYASECVLGATWNTELAREMGVMIGNEGLIGNEAGDGRPYSGWYAPAMNIHRSPFGGRNFEYYSEDGYLSGKMALNVVLGAREKGVYPFLKHFVLNEQETNRDTVGLITWANEQSMREIYFKPFEMSVKEGGATAVMSSFNRIGTTWTGGSYALLTSLLRDEWGFDGMVITDFNLKVYMNADQMLRAGGDLNLTGWKGPSSSSTPTDISVLRRAAHNILYTVANSCAMNGFGANVVWGYTLPTWMVWLIVINVVLLAITATLVALTVVFKMKNKNKISSGGKNL